MNKIIIMGNLGNDPETRQFNDNDGNMTGMVANFNVAVHETIKDKQGNKVKATEWFRCVAWGTTANFIEKYVLKGSKVLVEGKMKSRNWTDKNGQEKTTTELNVEKIELLNWPDNGEN
jgi:single-strand DNA-binding protein